MPALIHRALRLIRARRALAALVLLAAALALGLAAMRFSGDERRTTHKLTLALAEQPAFALIYIAQANGYFADEGLDVTFKNFNLGRDALQNVLEGKADLATAYETPAVLQIYQGQRLEIITTLHTSRTSHALLARRDRGIEKPTDLRGKRVGMTPGTSTEYFLSVLLATSGVNASDVRTVAVEPSDYEKALADGSVDALVAFNPALFKILESSPDRFAVLRSDVYVETSMLLGLRETLQTRREAVRRLLRAIVRAERYAQEHRDESLRIVVRRLAGKYPETAIRAGWSSLRLEVRLDHVLLALLNEEGRWFRDNGRFTTPVPDFRAAIADQFLASVRPEAVRFIATASERCAQDRSRKCD